MASLTDEQRKRMEENRLKALAKKRNLPLSPTTAKKPTFFQPPVKLPPALQGNLPVSQITTKKPATFQPPVKVLTAPQPTTTTKPATFQPPVKVLAAPQPTTMTKPATFQPPVKLSSGSQEGSPNKPAPWKQKPTETSSNAYGYTENQNFNTTSSHGANPSNQCTGTTPAWTNNPKSVTAPPAKDTCSSQPRVDNNSQNSKPKPPWLKNNSNTTTTNGASSATAQDISLLSNNNSQRTKVLDGNSAQTANKQIPPWTSNTSLQNNTNDSLKNNSNNPQNVLSKETKQPPWVAKTSVLPSKTATHQATISKPINIEVVDVQANKPQNVPNPMMGAAQVSGQCILISRSRFEVNIGYSAVLINIFKSMNTKRYDIKSKMWSFDLSEYSALMQKVRPLSPDVNVSPLPLCVTRTFQTHIQGKYQDKHVPDTDLSVVDRVLVEALLPFQREGVNFALHSGGRILLADDMGLGKTLQAICVAGYYRKEWPLLVVVPSSVRFAWREQFIKWLPSLDPQEINVVVTGKEGCTSGLVNIISYDMMVRKSEPLMAKGFKVIIMDESHSIKNMKTSRAKVALPLLKRARRVLLLSGTPALSRPNELFQQISAIDPSVFSKFHDFGMRYCDGKQNNWGWDFSGSSNLAELQLVLEERIMIRRLKKDVLQQLPSKIREMVILDPSSVHTTKSMKTSHKLVDKMKGTERRGALLQYFHDTCQAKSKAVKEYVLELLEGDRKLLVFAHHQEMLDTMEQALEKKGYGYIRIDGRTPPEQRNYLTGKFQNDRTVVVAILSIVAANAGLNLTAASLVVFAELFWNPGILVQAEDRAHRIGQQDSVNVHYLVAEGTADDYVWPLVQAKLDVLSRAGLTGDDFSAADTKRYVDPRQTQMMQYFEQSFIEDDDDMMQAENNVPITSSGETKKGKKTPEKPTGRSPVKQTSLFNYFQPSPKKTHNTSAENENNASTSTALNQQQEEETNWGEIDNEDWEDKNEKEDWGEEDEDVNLLQCVEEVSADTPWPPPCKKSKT